MVDAAFASLIGQPQAVAILSRAVEQQRIAPAYLLTGPDGVGRQLAALDFATLLLQRSPQPSLLLPPALRQRVRDRHHPDLLWVEPTYLHQGQRLSAAEAQALGVKRKAPPQIRLEQIREIGQFLSRPPLAADRAVVVIVAAESMAEAAANGLLKTLEEPKKATLILLAPDVDSLLPTLISRCQRVPFYRLSAADTQQILAQEGYVDLLEHPETLAIAQGSPGAAITSWQIRQGIPTDLLQALQQPLTSSRAALELARQIDQALDSETQLWLVDYLQQWCWQHGDRTQAIPHLHTLEQARRWLRSYVQPRLVWEVTLLRLQH